jgi:hypothetical protein
MKCTSCKTELNAGAAARRSVHRYLAVLFLLLILANFLPHPAWLGDSASAIWALALLFGRSILLWRSNDYSHLHPRFKLLGLTSNWWSIATIIGFVAASVFFIMHSPYEQLRWALPNDAEVLSDQHEQNAFLSDFHREVKVKVTRAQFEKLVDDLKLRAFPEKPDSYCKREGDFGTRLSFADGVLIFEEWEN